MRGATEGQERCAGYFALNERITQSNGLAQGGDLPQALPWRAGRAVIVRFFSQSGEAMKREELAQMNRVIDFLHMWPEEKEERLEYVKWWQREFGAAPEIAQKHVDFIRKNDNRAAAILAIMETLSDTDQKIISLRVNGKSWLSISFDVSYSERSLLDHYRQVCKTLLPLLAEGGLL